MNNDAFEFASTFLRIMVYPVGALALLNIAARRKNYRLGGVCMIVYFLYWCGCLVVQLFDRALYSLIVNYTATPLLTVIVIMLWVQVWRMRRE